MRISHPDDFMGDAIGELADEVRRELAAVGMRPEERWAMVLYKKLQVGAGAMFWGRCILPKHVAGEDGYHVTAAFRFPTTWEPKYEGFRFEALGRVRDPAKHAAGTEEPCPTIVLPPMLDRETGLLSPPFVLEAWRHRASHDPSPVFAQVDWRPGWTKEAYSFGGVTPTGKNDISWAKQGLKIMQWESGTGGPVAISDEEALEQAVQHGLEWLRENSGKLVRDFGDAELAAMLVISTPSVRTHMTRKHFGIKQVRREIRRRLGKS